MPTERFYEVVAQLMSRRGFLAKAGISTLGTLGALLGFSTKALATYSYACCNLCQPAGPASCSGCSWCWTCVCCSTCTCYNPTTVYYQCCECHDPSDPCDSSCVNVTNSWYTNLGCCLPGVAAA